MPEYLAPGVYVEEVSSGIKPIEGVSTSTAGFIGMAERGPEYPRLVASFSEFQRLYGGYIPDDSYLAYAIQGFFSNGGQRCYIARVVNENAAAAQGTLSAAVAVAALGRGSFGNNITVTISPASAAQNAQPGDAAEEWVKLEVQYVNDAGDAVLETFDNLTHRLGASNNLTVVVNSSSQLVRVWRIADPVALGAEQITLNGGDPGNAITPADFTGDTDPIPLVPPATFPPDELLGRGRGLAALATVDPISLLIAVDEVRNGLEPVTADVIGQCEGLADRFAIVSTLQGQSDENNIPFRQDTSYAAFYYPWIKVFDPALNDYRLIPPTGHIAGIFARTDIERGVHKAPANEVVRGAVDLEFPVTKAMQDVLNPQGVNCIRDFRSDGRGIRLWGARTMSSDPEWKYVNVRRLFLFLEESVDEGTQWVVFEPNDYTTWAKVVRNLTSFLTSVWRSGALMGLTQDEAFFVKCDRTTMTEDDINNGRLICYIGVAPVKPAEFVIFRISQKTLEATA
ncbi:MAG: phage tail sheath family protein [Candidatus Promineifilaceae bacterium]|nr:phage tail sheath family protein [Candidatus Promineifilaceae bacterium]